MLVFILSVICNLYVQWLLKKSQEKIGGPGKIVEIDESLLFLMFILLHTFF